MTSNTSTVKQTSPRRLTTSWLARHRSGVLTTVTGASAAVTLAVGCLAATTSASEVAHRSSVAPAPVATSPAAPTVGVPQPAPAAQVAASSAAGKRPRTVLAADLMVTSRRPLSLAQQRSLAGLRGVRTTLALASGTVVVGRARVRAVAADLSRIRGWMPASTAASDPLWAAVAAGAVAASFDAGKNVPLPLGSAAVARGGHGPSVQTRIGAYASSGLPGVDLTVNPALGDQLGLVPASVLLVSAPTVDPDVVKGRISSLLGGAVTVQVLVRRLPVVTGSGATLSAQQVGTILRTALAQVGKPYVWGATGPDSFDCSGLTGFAYAAAGIRLPRVSEQQWLAGLHVRPQDALPGDLLFWANDPADPQDIDHVALYLGNGQMVSAPHTGAFVHVGPIPARNFRGVVRIVPAH